jgi:hypothetical protein
MAAIDERIEALTQSVDLLAHQSMKNDRRSHQRFEQIASPLENLLKLAQNHERRIARLEKGDAA